MSDDSSKVLRILTWLRNSAEVAARSRHTVSGEGEAQELFAETADLIDKQFQIINTHSLTIWDLKRKVEELEPPKTGAGRKIIEGLREAAAGDFARVHIDGQTWVREK